MSYGDGAGSISYVGTCDAGAVNTVTLTLDALYDASGEIAPGSYDNPTPVSREVLCEADRDVAVTFDVTLARDAQQGFFDIGVNFDDIFCAAKLDCVDGGADLKLLHDADGQRALTAVLGFACTASPTGTTYLYMDDPTITCSGLAQDVVVDASALGNVDLGAAPSADADGYLFAAAVYRGDEQLAQKSYWNIDFGLDVDTFAAAGSCVLHGRATASSTAFPQELEGFPLPEGSVYPVIDWTVALSDASG